MDGSLTSARPSGDAGPYDGPIVDAHQHFWEPARNFHPWLSGPELIPFRYGDYSALKRDYLPDDYRVDAGGHRVEETVYVETEWDPSDPIGETRYASALAERHGLPNAIVAQAWLDRPDAAEVLAAQAAFPLVRSVRHKPGGPASPAEAGTRLTLMSDPRWREGYALLESHGLHFDLQTPWWNLAEAARLARDFPRTTLILNHTGLPSDRSPDGLAGWRRAMEDLSDAPNALVKVSGLGQRGLPWTVEANGPLVRDTIAIFGPERVMFASNFPVDGLCASLDVILSGFKTIAAGYRPADQRAMFCDNARRVYGTRGAA